MPTLADLRRRGRPTPHVKPKRASRPYDGQMLRLAHRKGRPAKLRARHVLLSADGIEFFEEQSKDKLPGAPLSN
jgi:hypothetical protein